jgi:hypothetical protein
MNIDTFQVFEPEGLIQMFFGDRELTMASLEDFFNDAKNKTARGLRPFHLDMSNGISLDIRFNLHIDKTDKLLPKKYMVCIRYAKDGTWMIERHVADVDELGVAYYNDHEHIRVISESEESPYSFKTERVVNRILANYKRSTVHHFDKCITIVSVQMPNGFVLTESSTCVDPASFDVEIGTRACIARLKPRVWMLLAYDKMTMGAEDGNCQH